MKVAVNEIKKNLQGTHSGEDEAENQINDLEHKEGKNMQSEQQEEKNNSKKMRRCLGTSGTSLNISTSKSWDRGAIRRRRTRN